MQRHTWTGGVESNVVAVQVLACKGNMTEPPNDMTITRNSECIDVEASERFIVVLKVSGQWIASCHSHEVIMRSWENRE